MKQLIIIKSLIVSSITIGTVVGGYFHLAPAFNNHSASTVTAKQSTAPSLAASPTPIPSQIAGLTLLPSPRSTPLSSISSPTGTLPSATPLSSNAPSSTPLPGTVSPSKPAPNPIPTPVVNPKSSPTPSPAPIPNSKATPTPAHTVPAPTPTPTPAPVPPSTQHPSSFYAAALTTNHDIYLFGGGVINNDVVDISNSYIYFAYPDNVSINTNVTNFVVQPDGKSIDIRAQGFVDRANSQDASSEPALVNMHVVTMPDGSQVITSTLIDYFTGSALESTNGTIIRDGKYGITYQ